MKLAQTTLMKAEATETPICLQQQLERLRETLEALGKQLRQTPPRMVITCGRGSSDHAGVFGRYLIETTLGIPTSSATPSTLSIYGTETQLEGCLVICISQSGQSPDLVNYAESAKRSGALVIGLINQYEGAPLSEHCDFVLPLCAGPEKSVAATKSYLCTLFAMMQLLAAWTNDESLKSDLKALPEQMTQAQGLDWSEAADALESANNMLVLGRGPGLGISNELALKFKETCALHAESFSAAEVLHGPLAMIRPSFPVFIFNQGDASSDSIDESVDRLLQAGATIILASSRPIEGCINLPVLDNLHPWCTLLTYIQSGYYMIESLSQRRGYSPDEPLHIAKVTKTL